jgi:ABC-type molybdate transport system permease subunit
MTMLLPDILVPLLLSIKLAAITTLLLLLLGTPLAWWLASTRLAAKPVIESLVALPLVLPPTVMGFYLLILLGPAGGVGRWWLELTGSALTFSFSGLVIASVLYSLPFVVQPLQASVAACWKRRRRSAPRRSMRFSVSPCRWRAAVSSPPACWASRTHWGNSAWC